MDCFYGPNGILIPKQTINGVYSESELNQGKVLSFYDTPYAARKLTLEVI